ncbi:hypothetical protein HDU76_001262 [Blyttiomyces sp. JEL0837]|nr:hypothetical protein HDU76_001262 [Blyttiomyces sp. JEL0837]
MGRPHRQFLDDQEEDSNSFNNGDPPPKIYGCSECKTHLTRLDSLVSKDFRGHHGRAWMFKQVVNVRYGELDTRSMLTGVYNVVDVMCITCNGLLGWKYEKAFEESQKFKENKIILERNLLVDVNSGDDSLRRERERKERERRDRERERVMEEDDV